MHSQDQSMGSLPYSVIHFGGIVDTILMGCNTPLTANKCHMRFTFTVKKLGDDALSSSVGQAFVAEIDKQVQEDTPIWQNKAYLARPTHAHVYFAFIRNKLAAALQARGYGYLALFKTTATGDSNCWGVSQRRDHRDYFGLDSNPDLIL